MACPSVYTRRVDLDLVFLGTSGSMPTAQRAPTALLVRRGGERLLFGSLRRIFGRLTYEYVLVELRPGEALERGDYRLETFPVSHGVSALGYALVEQARPGRFDVAAADALGVPEGPERGALQHGDPVTLTDGRVITPDAVLGPPRSGRKLAITGDTAPFPAVLEAVRGADVLVTEATFLEEECERARETSHSTALEAARLARH